MNRLKVAVIDKDLRTREMLDTRLSENNYKSLTAAKYSEAREKFDLNEVDYVITDLRYGMLEPGITNIESPTILYSTLDPSQVAGQGYNVTGDGRLFEKIQEDPPVFYAIRNYIEFDEIEEILNDEWEETEPKKTDYKF